MLEDIKQKLIDNPDHIVSLLDLYGFAHIRIRSNEIRAAFEEGMNPTAIVIRLQNNENLFVKDYERGLSCDLINYIIKAKGATFKDVLNAIKKELGIESIYNFKRQTGLFNGLYNRLSRSNNDVEVKTYPEEILEQYGHTPNLLWLRDGISLETQCKWGVGYSVESQRITLPIRTSTGEIMAIKGRLNGVPEEFEPKYLYLVNGPMSATLFGYFENHDSLYENDVFVVESEKSVLKLDSWGHNNVVAIGSNSLSPTQAKLLLSLNPKSITFLLDKSLPLENTKRNVEVLRTFCTMRQLDVKYWRWTDNITLPEKSAPCDDTREEFEWIVQNEIYDTIELEG